MEIKSAKLIVEILDEITGELITREATLGDFKEVKKSTSTRIKKPKDDDPVAKLTLLEGKVQLNNAAIQLTGYEPDMKIDIKFEKKGRITCPIMMQAESGNRLTKTYTISCRGSKHDNLAEYGDKFEVVPSDRAGFFKLIGNAEKEDDIVDVPEEITNLEELNMGIDDSETDIDDFDLNFD